MCEKKKKPPLLVSKKYTWSISVQHIPTHNVLLVVVILSISSKTPTYPLDDEAHMQQIKAWLLLNGEQSWITM
jgi:hypothetical protein